MEMVCFHSLRGVGTGLSFRSLAMAKASEVFGSDSDARVKEIKGWLKTKGVRDFEPVSLFCDQLTKVCGDTIRLDDAHKRTTRAPLRRLRSLRIPLRLTSPLTRRPS